MPRLPRALSWLEPWLQPRRYWIDNGRHVDEISRTRLRYHEEGRSIVAGYEDLGNGEIGVFPQQIGGWEPPHPGDEALGDRERERIIAAIREAYARRGIVVADSAELVSPDAGIALAEDWNQRRARSPHRDE